MRRQAAILTVNPSQAAAAHCELLHIINDSLVLAGSFLEASCFIPQLYARARPDHLYMPDMRGRLVHR
jgi:hypothetical protein